MKVYPITIAFSPVSRHNEQPIDGCISLFIQKHNMRYKHFSICIIQKKKFLRMQNKHNHTIQSEAQNDKLVQNHAKQKKEDKPKQPVGQTWSLGEFSISHTINTP